MTWRRRIRVAWGVLRHGNLSVEAVQQGTVWMGQARLVGLALWFNHRARSRV
jgi:hypothetical protein